MALSKKPYKGTRDFFPAEKRTQDFLFSKMHESSLLFGYEPYDGPLLEEVELYKAKSGEELINDQIYDFTDRGKRHVAIRPEMTPTLARMVSQIHREYPKPIRWYSIPNLYRYERPQRGRLREHWQFNCDIFGAPGRSGEVEIIQVLIHLLESYGANSSHFEVLVNDRTVVDAIFHKVSEDKDTVYKLYKLVDKSKKIPTEALDKELNSFGLPASNQDLFKKYLELKNFNELVTFLKENDLSSAADDFSGFYTELKNTGLEDYLRFDPTIVRGLDYYTGVVFEVFDKHPDNRRAISGGGAYANLLQIFDEPALSGVGFGLGDVTLKDFLSSHNLLPDFSKADIDILVSYQIDEGKKVLAPLVKELRAAGLKTVFNLESLKFKKVFNLAEKKGADYAILFGEKEKDQNIVILKNLSSKTQQELPLKDISAIINECKKRNP